ncbi:ScyD/ScyE family protein [Cellulomonas gelida]|uniref:ScyD/ScyE family protein n=1 Tax=Cellulomonas gelida TaxID=1712 RepID=UPI003620F734
MTGGAATGVDDGPSTPAYAPAGPGSGHPGHHHGGKVPALRGTTTVAEHLAGPLTFGVGRHGSLVVGQAFAAQPTSVPKSGAPVPWYQGEEGTDVAAVSIADGTTTFATRVGDQESVSSSLLMQRDRRGTIRQVADLLAFEQSANPDAVNTYGFTDLPAECAAQVPPMFAPYTGAVDSHAYGSVTVHGLTYVADAGANAILSVDRRGTVRTVAVLPPLEVTVTAEAADTFGLPDCVVGESYGFEPVPTDVEVGRHGALYVTTLPGGPEDGSLGANGALHRIDPRTGRITTLATGFAGATGVALDPSGNAYVAELQGNEVSVVTRWGKVRVLGAFTQPAGVEWANGTLYVSTDVFGDGSIVAAKVR